MTVFRRALRATGLYLPPPGTLAVAGMLLDATDTRRPVASAEVVLVLDGSGQGLVIRSARSATTDERGGFVAAAGASDITTPMPAEANAPEGTFKGWLEVTVGGESRRSDDENFRQARLTHLTAPLVWADLAEVP